MPDNYFNSRHGVTVIAEIGVNHNGDLDLAKEMLMAAAEAGADAIKFQTFSADRLVNPSTPKVAYQNSHTDPSESHYDMIKRLELSRDDHFRLKDACNDVSVEFLSTPYDVESAQFLIEELGVDMLKSASADLVDLELHSKFAESGVPSIVSVGMASMSEIEDVVQLYDLAGNEDIILLHCVSNYPCSYASLNLNVITTLKNTFGCPVGFSDHSVGYQASMLAVGLGSKIVEKHFTIDKTLPGPDQKASSNPVEFKELVSNIRLAQEILGSGEKSMQEEELAMARVSRKSLHYASSLEVGTLLNKEHFVLMRPGSGLLARELSSVIGRKLVRSVDQHKLVDIADFS